MLENKPTEGKSERRNAVKSDSSRSGSVRSSLDERFDGSARTLDDNGDFQAVAVQSLSCADQSPLVDGVACQRDDRVTTHRAVTSVVHEDDRQICITWTDNHEHHTVERIPSATTERCSNTAVTVTPQLLLVGVVVDRL